jgi:alpha-beta hydrolase superfamily lysophospholipase
MFALAWHSVVFVVGLAAMLPVRVGNLRADPHPATSYAAAIALVQRMQTTDDSVVAPGGRSILLTHGSRAARVAVLYHGLTDSPMQFLPFAEELYNDGYNVLIPRLPHHAERAGNMATLGELNVHELRELGDRAVDAAVGLGDTVVVAGLSAGGTIAAWTAQYRPEVKRVVLIAPAIAVTKLPERLNAPAIRLALRVPNVRHGEPRDATEPDRLPGWTSHALAEVVLLGTAVHDDAGAHRPATAQIALLLNGNDRTIPAGAALDLMHRWSDRGANARAFELDEALRLPHDAVDPRQPASDTAVVYPVLRALMDGREPVNAALREISTSGHPLPRTLASSAPAPR